MTDPTAPPAARMRVRPWPLPRGAGGARGGEGLAGGVRGPEGLDGEAAAPAYAPATPSPLAATRARKACVARVLAQLDGLDAEALAEVADAVVTRLAAEPLSGAADEQALADDVLALFRLERRVTAEWYRRVGELHARAAGPALGCRSVVDWLSTTLALTGYEARSVVETAQALDELPNTAARFAAGELSSTQAHAAARAHAELARVAAERAAEASAEADRRLAEAEAEGDRRLAEADAGGVTPAGDAGPASGHAVGATGPAGRGLFDAFEEDLDDEVDDLREELDRLIAEDAASNRAETRQKVGDWQRRMDERLGVEREDRAWQRRAGWISVDQVEASGKAHFELDAVGIATAKAAVEALARKRGPGDDRTWRQRMADAFVTICQQALDDPDALPETAGGRPQVLVIRQADGGEEAAGGVSPQLNGVGSISNATADMISCDGRVTEVVVDADGRPVQTRETGQVTLAQRQALIARDRSCIGCGAPVSQTQVHHIVYRRNHGATAVVNLALVCFGCHRRIHHHRWQVVRDAGGYRLVAPAHPDAEHGIRQPVHCGRQPI